MKKVKFAGIALLAVSTLLSCSSNDDNPKLVNEEEVITSVITTLTNGDQVITLSSRDLDGNGPNPPVVTVSGPLAVNTEYSGEVRFLNETGIPVEDMTDEIREEGTAHQLFYQATPALGTILYNDADNNGKPLGLKFKLTTFADPASGNLIITLKHQPDKNAPGVTEGNLANAGGATDAQVSYPLVVE
jgi:hypothetical protein